MTFSSQMENRRLWFPKTRTDGRGHSIFVWIIRQPFLAFSSQAGSSLRLFNRALGGQAFCPNALHGSHCLCLSVWLWAVHEVKRLISGCRAIHREPLYSMGPFGTIVRVATIALCFDTLHTGPSVHSSHWCECEVWWCLLPKYWLLAAN